jgi:transglutaminase-like putative cysteine protease
VTPARQSPPSPPASPALRVAVAVCAVSSVAALGAAGLLSLPARLLLPLVVAAAAAAPARMADPAGTRLRKVSAAVVLGIAGLSAVLVTQAFGGTTTLAELPADLGPRLALLVVGVLVAQLLLGERQRDVLVSLVVAGTATVLALAGGPGAAVAVPLAVAWPALVTALALAHATSVRARADAVAVVAGRRASVARGPLVAVIVVSALVAVVVLLVAPRPQGLQRTPQSGGSDDTTGDPSRSRSSAAYASGDLDLRVRGSLPDTPVADVPGDSPTLWRGAVLDVYDGTTWRSSVPLGSGPLQGGPTFRLPVERDAAGPTARVRNDTVRTREAFTSMLLAPGTPTQVTGVGAVYPLGSGFGITAGRAGPVPASYTVTSLVPVTDPAALRAAAGSEPVAGWTGSLPPTVPARVRDLGDRLTSPATTRYGEVRAVERYLRTHATYRLDSPVPPAGQDAVDHFLFEAHTGFCEQFASAEVVLLRAAGVPARLATGFAGGRANGDHRTLLSSDAHAWVEVFYPGVGWSPSDPTAGVPLAEPTGRDRAADLLRHARGRLLVALLLVGAALLGWAVVVVVGVLRRRARRRRLLAARPALLAAYDRFERVLARSGRPRAPAESLAALAARPRLAQLPGLAAALGTVERSSYAASPPTGPESAAAARVLDEAGVLLLADRPTAASGGRPRRLPRG